MGGDVSLWNGNRRYHPICYNELANPPSLWGYGAFRPDAARRINHQVNNEIEIWGWRDNLIRPNQPLETGLA